MTRFVSVPASNSPYIIYSDECNVLFLNTYYTLMDVIKNISSLEVFTIGRLLSEDIYFQNVVFITNLFHFENHLFKR